MSLKHFRTVPCKNQKCLLYGLAHIVTDFVNFQHNILPPY